MVSAWGPVKRHEELFRTLAKLRAHGRTLRVALIGYPSTWTREHIEGLLRKHGVEECCTIYEAIPHEEVARIVADSRAYVLLSRREGANRALYEALFCDTPAIVYSGHRGVNIDHITDEVGVLFEDGKLDDAVLRILDGPQTFRPRAWALANTGWENSTRTLNQALRGMAARQGEPWTRDIAPKKMAPNLRYAIPGLHREFAGEYERLGAYLLPVRA
jgi:glycosyltransferase involved in cell wall biosynthesis